MLACSAFILVCTLSDDNVIKQQQGGIKLVHSDS